MICGMRGQGTAAGEGGFPKTSAKVAGVFSPAGRCGKTMFALSLSLLLEKNKPALYLNLESCPALPESLTGGAASDLGDVLYYLRQGNEHCAARILPAVEERGGLCYIPPCASPRELYSLGTAEWEILFRTLRNDTPYEAVIADLGDIPFLHPEILGECDEIYLPVPADGISRDKVNRFLSELREHAVLPEERLHRIAFPAIPDPGTSGDWFGQLRGSVFAGAAAECIREDHL